MVNIVEYVNKDLTLIKKEGIIVLVGRKKTTVMVVSADKKDNSGRPLMLLARECSSVDAAVKKHMYLVGKLCRKEVDSRFFGKAGYEKNMSNGDFDVHRKMDYIKWANEMLESVKGQV